MTIIPGIKQISQVGNDMYAQGAISIAGIGTTEVSYLADPADTRLLAGRDPVLEEISVGMSGVETEQKYATGAQPLTVTDAMLGNLNYCQVQFSPKQDLHGYDSPWPAGGGVNKANLTDATNYESGNSFVTSFDQDSETIIITGTYICTVGFAQYRFATFPNITNGLGLKAFEITSGEHVRSNEVTWDGSTQVMIIILRNLTNGQSFDIRFHLSAYEGTAPDTWTPYSNICPISGTDTVNVYVAESYDPAAAPEATVSLGAERFGGTADLVSGIGSEQYAEVDLGSLTWVFMSVNGVQRLCSAKLDPLPLTPRSDYFAPEITCSMYKTVTVAQLPNNPYSISMGYTGYGYGDRLIINDDTITSVEQATEKLSGQTCVYKLLSPDTFTFPGANDITLQEGSNTIWADTNGSDISVTYVTKK